MKAVVYRKYGSPDVLRIEDIKKPTPAENEVVVEVRASSINAADIDLLRGKFIIRLAGLFRPKYRVLGSDVAGVVESIGESVTCVQPGDEVICDTTEHGFGAFAEHVCVPEDALAPKPSCLTFEQAATAPSAGGVALLNLLANGGISPGAKVLINGAGGGMGTFAVQIAKSRGAEVTGVDTGGKLETIRSIGADRAVDYTKEDFTRQGVEYDLILDVAAHRSVSDYERALSAKGVFVFVGGSMKVLFQVLIRGQLLSSRGDKQYCMSMAYPRRDALVSLNEYLQAGTVVPVIDARYPLTEIADAFLHLESGRARGKIAITL